MVFSERPLLVFPRGLPIYSPLARKEATELQDSMFEEMLQQALRAMTKEDADAFMSLYSCLSHLSRVLGIVNTAFASGIEKQNLEEGKFGYSVIGKLASRINHRPNVEINFDIPSFSLQLVALRNIEADPQLFYCYSELYRSAKARQRELLTGYAFECQCEACVNATPERDKLREEMNDRIEKIAEEAEEMLAKPQLNLRSLDRWLELEKEIVGEGLDFG